MPAYFIKKIGILKMITFWVSTQRRMFSSFRRNGEKHYLQFKGD